MLFFLSPLIFITILSSIFFGGGQKVWANGYLQQAVVCHSWAIAQLLSPSKFSNQQNHPKNYKGGQQWIH